MKSEVVFSILGIIVSIYFYAESVRFGAGEGSLYRTGFYTQFLAVALTLLVIALVLENLWSYLKRKPEGKEKKEPGGRRLNVGLLFTIGILIISPAILKYIGFLLGGGIFLIATMMVLSLSIDRKSVNWKSFVLIVSVSIGILCAIYVLFKVILTIPLPQGMLIS